MLNPLLLLPPMASFTLTYLLTRFSVSILKKWGAMVEDYHKPEKPLVPRPGGPAWLSGLLVGEALLYFITGSEAILALILVVLMAGMIGLVDDIRVLTGPLKPALLLPASLPLLLLGAYSPFPEFPLFGSVRMTFVYPLLVIAAIPITANTINSIDVMNGVISLITALMSASLAFALWLKGDATLLLASLTLLVSSLAFYAFHRYPSKIFPGDSGALGIGAAYGALAIVGGVEVVGVVALLPAILNSFFFLSSVRALVEHRQLDVKPIGFTPDYKIKYPEDPRAPITLVGLLVADGPKGELEIARGIALLTALSSFLAALTAILTWGI